MIGAAGRADAGAFLARVLQLDRAAVVRLRPARSRMAEIWAMLPFGVLVVRTISGHLEVDTTVDAAALLASLREDRAPVESLRRRDEAWRWPLPPPTSRLVETVPADEIARIAAAASRTLRAATAHGVGGRAVGERTVREALLDHVPIVVTSPDGERVDVPQRLVQAIVRMGFLGSSRAPTGPTGVTLGEAAVAVRTGGAWIGLAASYGSAWYRPTSPLQIARGVDVDAGPFR